jgi:hypothetical protein
MIVATVMFEQHRCPVRETPPFPHRLEMITVAQCLA